MPDQDPELPKCVIPKPARGTARKARRARAKEAQLNERYEKGKVREREDRHAKGHGPCRWPHYTTDDKVDCRRAAKEVAHLDHKKMGGDKQTLRSRRHKMLQVCRRMHKQIDAGLAKVEFFDGARVGTDGPLRFLERERQSDPFHEVGWEISPGVLGPRLR